MLTKSEKLWIKSLQDKTVRHTSREFVAEGKKLVGELLQEKASQCKLLVVSKEMEENFWSKFPERIRTEWVDQHVLQSISTLKTTDSMLGVFKFPEHPESFTEEEEPFVLYLDHIKDPGNMGTIIRTADWFGLKEIFCSPECVDSYNNKVIQSSMASIMRVKITTLDWKEFRGHITGKEIFAASLNGEPYFNHERKKVNVLCIGNESFGLRKEILSDAHKQISIPRSRQSKTESLNAAVAASILMAWKFGQ